MKFIISRASVYEDSPWDGAVREPCQRTVHNADPAYPYPEYMVKWQNSGYNHRMEGKYFTREVDAKRWWINVDTLEELLGMIESSGHGVVVDRNKDYVDQPFEITIYDSYLE